MPLPPALLRLKYEEAAQAYLRSLPLEHFMEAIPQATQRKITLESFDVIHTQRPDVQIFNELLVQYELPDDRIGQVVPDNMVVVWDQPIKAEGSYDLPLQPVRPLLVMEYVSKSNRRKDYETNMAKYEVHVQAAYYLMFVPDAQELTLYKLRKRKYAAVKPNGHGRYPVPELELELALLDGWVRFWFRGQLVPLPAELVRELNETRTLLAAERQRADEQSRRADEQSRRADEFEQRAEQERSARLAAETELARLRELLKQQQPDS
jgi:Uma2 family endonuclease